MTVCVGQVDRERFRTSRHRAYPLGLSEDRHVGIDSLRTKIDKNSADKQYHTRHWQQYRPHDATSC